jgi:hypothetical protein
LPQESPFFSLQNSKPIASIPIREPKRGCSTIVAQAFARTEVACLKYMHFISSLKVSPIWMDEIVHRIASRQCKGICPACNAQNVGILRVPKGSLTSAELRILRHPASIHVRYSRSSAIATQSLNIVNVHRYDSIRVSVGDKPYQLRPI